MYFYWTILLRFYATAAELIKKSRPQRSYNPVRKIRKTNQAKLDIQKKITK